MKCFDQMIQGDSREALENDARVGAYFAYVRSWPRYLGNDGLDTYYYTCPSCDGCVLIDDWYCGGEYFYYLSHYESGWLFERPVPELIAQAATSGTVLDLSSWVRGEQS